MNRVLEQPAFKQGWPVVVAALLIKTEHDYRRAVALLDRLLDEVGDNERHPLFSFVEVLGTMVESYESDHVHISRSAPQAVLKFLMAEHDLTQSDLPEIGSQGVVSEVLRGKRALNVRQIKALSARFAVSPGVFF